MNTAEMKIFTEYIRQTFRLIVIPVRVKNEKRWESMDEIIDHAMELEGVPQNILLGDGYGVVVYSFELLSRETVAEIQKVYQEQSWKS